MGVSSGGAVPVRSTKLAPFAARDADGGIFLLCHVQVRCAKGEIL